MRKRRTTPPLFLDRPFDRRSTLSLLGALGAGLVAACADDADPAQGGAGGGGGSTGGAGGASGGNDAEGGAGGGGATGQWATGGTASMSGSYPDPFTEALGASCDLTCVLTLGPCYAETLERRDISEGFSGLPVRLALLVVDETCTPVEGAVVDVWHTRNNGVYSGEDAASMCTGDDPEALASRWFRGTQTSDAAGRVDFDTCYPGWYGGRCVHIHFQVRIGDQEYVTSQLFFPDELSAELFATHPEYAPFGQPDTTNATDGIYGGPEYELSTEPMSDGALLAWKVLVVRSSIAQEVCGEAGGPGGP